MNIQHRGVAVCFSTHMTKKRCLHCGQLVWLQNTHELVLGGVHAPDCSGVARREAAAEALILSLPSRGNDLDIFTGVNIEDTYPFFYGFEDYSLLSLFINDKKIPQTMVFTGPSNPEQKIRAISEKRKDEPAPGAPPSRQMIGVPGVITKFEDIFNIDFNDGIDRPPPRNLERWKAMRFISEEWSQVLNTDTHSTLPM